jgi:hypothetical protein
VSAIGGRVGVVDFTDEHGLTDLDPAAFMATTIPVSAQEVFQVRLTGDGRRAVTRSLDRIARVIDLPSRTVVEPGFPSNGDVRQPTRVEVSPDGRRIAVPAAKGVLLWDIDPDGWRRRACEVVGRNLTAEEWTTFMPNGGAHRKTCDRWGLVS